MDRSRRPAAVHVPVDGPMIRTGATGRLRLRMRHPHNASRRSTPRWPSSCRICISRQPTWRRRDQRGVPGPAHIMPRASVAAFGRGQRAVRPANHPPRRNWPDVSAGALSVAHVRQVTPATTFFVKAKHKAIWFSRESLVQLDRLTDADRLIMNPERHFV